MTLDIASQAHPDVSAFDQIMAEEQRFGEPPGKHPVEDKPLIGECVTGRRRGTEAVWRGQTRGAGGGGKHERGGNIPTGRF
jgi:hypothetical protein